MNNFKIRAAANNVTEIDIMGEIGEDWWTGEGNTLETVKADIAGIKSQEIIVNISSLGGDATQGLAIHDALKNHSAKITSNIEGWTASAGTMVAMAGDHIQIAENAQFLAHEGSGMTLGTVADHEKTIKTLSNVNSSMVKMYKNQTDKAQTDRSEDDIRVQMSKDEWQTAEEAKDFGFVDEIVGETKIAAKVDIDKINNSNLPKTEIMSKVNEENKTTKVEETTEETKETVKAPTADEVATSVMTKLKSWFKKDKEEKEVTATDEVKDFINAQFKELSDANEALKAQLEEKKTQATDLSNKLEGKETTTEQTKDPAIDSDEAVSAHPLDGAALLMKSK